MPSLDVDIPSASGFLPSAERLLPGRPAHVNAAASEYIQCEIFISIDQIRHLEKWRVAFYSVAGRTRSLPGDVKREPGVCRR